MRDKSISKPNVFEFIENTHWILRFIYFFHGKMVSFQHLMFDTPPPPSCIFKRNLSWRTIISHLRGHGYISLNECAQAMGFHEEAKLALLTLHKRRVNKRMIVIAPFYIIFSAILVICFEVILGNIISSFVLTVANHIGNTDISFALMVTSYIEKISTVNINPYTSYLHEKLPLIIKQMINLVFAFIYVTIFLKISSIIIDKYYADSLCVLTVIYLVFELNHYASLGDPYYKKRLLSRIDDLSRHTILLSIKYKNNNEESIDWVKRHFKNLELYIRERARWVVAPIETTIFDLQRDFNRLAQIYISGNFGDFKWVESDYTIEQEPFTWKQYFVMIALRFIAFAPPIIIIALILKYQTELGNIGIPVSMVTLISLAWILLAIDNILKLGITAGIVDLAKAIKELK